MNLRSALLALPTAVASIVASASLALVPSAAARSPGDVSVLAIIPSPGYPALPHLVGGYIYEGTYDNPSGSALPSRVLDYTTRGALLNSWTVAGQDTSKAHGVQVAANDARGRLLLLDKTSGRIIQLDPATGAQTPYSRVPDLPTCGGAAAGQPCSPAVSDLPPMPDYAAWGPDASLYVTDYQQAVIWRIPPGGGTPQIWLADPKLDGGPFGTACILSMPGHRTLLFDQASNGGLGTLNPSTGKLYEVTIGVDGRPGPLRQLWESGPADAPDGCALSQSGHIYVALAGASNQIVELDASGHELARFGQQYTGSNNSSIPFDTPSGLAYSGTDLIVANQSFASGNSANQALLSVETGETGMPIYVPPNAGLKPTSKRRHHHHRRRRRRTHAAGQLAEPSTAVRPPQR